MGSEEKANTVCYPVVQTGSRGQGDFLFYCYLVVFFLCLFLLFFFFFGLVFYSQLSTVDF